MAVDARTSTDSGESTRTTRVRRDQMYVYDVFGMCYPANFCCPVEGLAMISWCDYCGNCRQWIAPTNEIIDQKVDGGLLLQYKSLPPIVVSTERSEEFAAV